MTTTPHVHSHEPPRCGWQAGSDDVPCTKPSGHATRAVGATPHRVRSPYGDGRWSEYDAAGVLLARGGGWSLADRCPRCGQVGDHVCAWAEPLEEPAIRPGTYPAPAEPTDPVGAGQQRRGVSLEAPVARWDCPAEFAFDGEVWPCVAGREGHEGPHGVGRAPAAVEVPPERFEELVRARLDAVKADVVEDVLWVLDQRSRQAQLDAIDRELQRPLRVEPPQFDYDGDGDGGGMRRAWQRLTGRTAPVVPPAAPLEPEPVPSDPIQESLEHVADLADAIDRLIGAVLGEPRLVAARMAVRLWNMGDDPAVELASRLRRLTGYVAARAEEAEGS